MCHNKHFNQIMFEFFSKLNISYATGSQYDLAHESLGLMTLQMN